MMCPHPDQTPEKEALISLVVDDEPLTCKLGQTVASALLMRGIYHFRLSPNMQGSRGPFCMMGSCQECAILIDGSIRRACQTDVQDGMVVSLRGAGAP